MEAIDCRCGGPSQPFQSSGRAGWVRNLIYRELGITPPPRSYKKGRGISLPLHLIDFQALQPLEQLLVGLALRGNTFHQITQYLIDRDVIPLAGSKKWYPSQVERILNEVVARGLVASQGT